MSKIGRQNIRAFSEEEETQENRMRRMIFPDLRYAAGIVPVRTRMSRVLCGERSGAVYICSREKTRTHHASARLDLQSKTRNNLTTRPVNWWRPKARLILIPYAFLVGDTSSRLREVDGASHTANSTEVSAALGTRVSRLSSARKMAIRSHLSHVYVEGLQPSTCIYITDALRPP
jgi:hypothetical protein